MKRRSARPFTVEVKSTRTSRASLTTATANLLSGKALQNDWAPLFAASEPLPQPIPEPSSPRPQPEAPARRVLPSLVPMCALPGESDPPVEAAEPTLPRVRHPRAKAERALTAEEPSLMQRPIEPLAIMPPVAGETASVVADPPASRTEALPSQPARASRRETKLRSGERWKRRLPCILR